MKLLFKVKVSHFLEVSFVVCILLFQEDLDLSITKINWKEFAILGNNLQIWKCCYHSHSILVSSIFNWFAQKFISVPLLYFLYCSGTQTNFWIQTYWWQEQRRDLLIVEKVLNSVIAVTKKYRNSYANEYHGTFGSADI